MSLRKKSVCIIFAAFGCVTIFLVSFLNSFFLASMKQQIKEDAQLIVDQYIVSFEEYLKRLSNLSLDVNLNHTVSEIISNQYDSNSESTRRQMDEYFYNVTVTNQVIEGMAFVMEDGRFFHNSSTTFKIADYDFTYAYWDQLYKESAGENLAIVPLGEAGEYFALIKEIEIFPKIHPGYMVVLVGCDKFFYSLNSKYLETNQAQILIQNQNDQIIFSNFPNMQVIKNNDPSLEKDNMEGTFIFSADSDFAACKITLAMTLQQATQMQKLLDRLKVLLIAITLLLAFVVSTMIVWFLLKDISHLSNRMKQVGEGKKNVDFGFKQSKEVREISLAIQNMLFEIKELHEKEIDFVNRQNQLEMDNMEAKMYALQNQVNPHFLYNILDSVRMKALINEDREIFEMLGKLSKLFRSHLSQKEPMISVEEEVAIIQNYFEIQKFRFSGKINYEIDIDSSLLQVLIPRLVIQPMIENAIVHGLEPSLNPGCVIVRGRKKGKNIEFVIEDNGVGISSEHLQKLKNQMAPGAPIQTHSIGLINTAKRLYGYYGDMASVAINSVEGQGTTVTISFPL